MLQEITASSLRVGDRTIAPALFLAPMAGVTHSAFRRLVADFGGYGALFTEMLSSTALLGERLHDSPFTKRRDSEGPVVYQLRVSGDEDTAAAVRRLAQVSPFGIDINLGCPAPEIRKLRSGIALFRDYDRLEHILRAVRDTWNGPLTVKCRLGDDVPGWRDELARRFELFEKCGVDAVTVHPRFADEKLKRRARWELFEWLGSLCAIPLIANGDITGADDTAKGDGALRHASGLMIGRMAAVKPWIFAEMTGQRVALDYREVWERFCTYTLEDFTPEKAIGRIKEFTSYYARNFFFGHDLYRFVQGAQSLDLLYERAVGFLSNSPRLAAVPSVAGL